MPKDRPLTPEDHVQVDWGGDFAARYHAAFPDQPNAVVSICYAPLALYYILAPVVIASFLLLFVLSFLASRSLSLFPSIPAFSYFAFFFHSFFDSLLFFYFFF